MWKQHSHTLAPLSALASPESKWMWTDEEQKAFDKAKRMVAREASSAHPDFSEEFHIHADASDCQPGGAIMQNNEPLAFHTRKMNAAQAKCSVGEQELLSLVETLKTFEGTP